MGAPMLRSAGAMNIVLLMLAAIYSRHGSGFSIRLDP